MKDEQDFKKTLNLFYEFARETIKQQHIDGIEKSKRMDYYQRILEAERALLNYGFIKEKELSTIKKIGYSMLEIFFPAMVYLGRQDKTPETIVRNSCFSIPIKKDLGQDEGNLDLENLLKKFSLV